MAIYYVDATTGDDDDTGLSEALAWQTIAKVNASSFSAGDSVLFKRGETWSGTRLIIAWSGSEGSPITFGAYGTGARPIIDGTGLDGALFISIARSWIDLDGLRLSGGTYACVANGSHINGTDLEFDSATEMGFSSSGAAATTHNITLSYCIAHDNVGAHGIYFGYSGAGGPSNILVEYCTSYDNGDTYTQDHGIYFAYVTNGTMQYNTSYANNSCGLYVRNCVGPIIIKYNLSYSNGFNGIDLGAGQAAGGGSQVIYNLLYDNHDYGISVAPTCDGYLIANNTIVNNGVNGISLAAGAESHVIKNNIIYQDNAVYATRPIRVGTTTEISANTWGYNLVYFKSGDGKVANVTSPTDGLTWAEWQAEGADAHGVNDNPDFVTDYTDLHLQATSPCINAGADVDLTEDIEGNPIW